VSHPSRPAGHQAPHGLLARIWLTAALLALCGSSRAADPGGAAADRARGGSVVVVFDIQDQGARLAKDLLERMSDYLATRLAELAGYQVVPRNDIKTRLQSEKSGTYKACYDQSCQIELGREMAAEKTISGKVVKLGSRCAVTIALYDLRKATTELAATSERGGCTEDAIVDMLDEVTRKLALGSPAAPPQAAARVEPLKESSPADFVGTWDFLHSGVETIIHEKGKPADAIWRYSRNLVEFSLGQDGSLGVRLDGAWTILSYPESGRSSSADVEETVPGTMVQRVGEKVLDPTPTAITAHHYPALRTVEVEIRRRYADNDPDRPWSIVVYWFVLSSDGTKLGLMFMGANFEKYKSGKLDLDEWMKLHLVEHEETRAPFGQCVVKELRYAVKRR
jgi:hypothetical protein